MPFSPAPFQIKGPMVVLESRYSVTIHHFIYLVFHPMKTSHFAALLIIFRNSWGNSQATSETIFCLIGKWCLGNEICWCPVTHLLSFPSDWNYPFAFGLSEVWLFAFFIWIFQTKGICGVLIFPNSYLVETAVVATVSHPSTWFQHPEAHSMASLMFFFFFLLPCLHSCSLLCCLSLSPLFHHHCCWRSSVSHCCCTAVTNGIKKNVWAREGSMCREGKKMQNITCPYFSREDLSSFYEREALPSTCTPLMYPSD